MTSASRYRWLYWALESGRHELSGEIAIGAGELSMPILDLHGKRVAMIGTGASAVQAGPSIASDADRLLVFQRTPHWLMNNPNYHKAVSAGNKWAIEHIPYFGNWLRFQLFWAGSDGFHASLQMDPDWPMPNSSLNEANHKMREAHGGSIIFHTECQVRYITQALREMIENGYSTLEVRADVHDGYNKLVDEKCRNMVWAHPGVTSWYKNRHNRVTVTSPWRLLDYWKLTQHFVPEEYRAGRPGHTPIIPGQEAAAVSSVDRLTVG